MPCWDVLEKSCIRSLFSISVVLHPVQFYWGYVGCNSGYFEEADPVFNLTEEGTSRFLNFGVEMASPGCLNTSIHLILHSCAYPPSRSLVCYTCGMLYGVYKK